MNIVKALFSVFLIIGLAPMALAMPNQSTIVDVAVTANQETGEFSTLIAAILAADPVVVNTLNGKGKFTVFAPTDAAFAKLGLNADNVVNIPQETLTDILLYHVMRGNRDAESILPSSRLRMMNGQFLFQNQGTLIDQNQGESLIVATDIKAKNGIIHVIDSVVIPK
jgi:uncharacterized surface protein with fasciclin (FAS1) repeats